MTDVRWIRTETPEAEQWRQLGQFRYRPNVRRYLADRMLAPAADGIEDYVSGSIGQAEAYYTAAKAAPLDISPMLAYYGATSLLCGAAALMRGYPLPINNHGMAVNVPRGAARVSDVEVVVRNVAGSGLHAIAAAYENSPALPGQTKWTVGELLASLPDLKDDVRLCIPDMVPFALRVDTVHKESISIDRILLSEFGIAGIPDTLLRISGFSDAYLRPQRLSDALILYRKLNGVSIGTESLYGQRVLLLGHAKGRCLYTPGQIVTQLMALFALGSVSRYNPTLWHPFVHTDSTGERLLIERFLALAVRWLPNLVLSAVTEHWTRFTSEPIQIPNGLEALSEDDLRSRIKEMLAELKP